MRTIKRLSLYSLAHAAAGLLILTAVSCHNHGKMASASKEGNMRMQEQFTGYSLSVEAAIQSAPRIVLGRLVGQGNPDLGSLGETYYDNASLEVIRWFRSEHPENVSEKHLAFAYTIQTLPANSAERPPVVGHTYLFFLVARTSSTPRAIKILSSDDPRVGDIDKTLLGH